MYTGTMPEVFAQPHAKDKVVTSLSSQSTSESGQSLTSLAGYTTASAVKLKADSYDLLIGPDSKCAQPSILYGWWPKSSNWSWGQLVERCTRCLPAVRPSLDIVALPDLPEVHELWQNWCEQHFLSPEQAVWFPPHLGEKTIDNPAFAVCRAVLASAQVMQVASGCLHFYPMYATDTVAAEARGLGLPIIGDAEDHEIMPLSSAKAWLHPRITDDGHPCSSSLRDMLPPSSQGVRGPRGYVATSLTGLQAAWKRLQNECPASTRFVLKPSSGSGGCGVVLDVKLEDLNAFDFSCPKNSAIIEEMVVGGSPLQSPTLYMIGNSVCGQLADQVLLDDGVTNIGNTYPSKLRADLLTVCAMAAQKLNKHWGLTSNWGMDFVIDAGGDPIIVDLNMGRPNGNFAVRLWASRQNAALTLFTGSWAVPAADGPTITAINNALTDESLLWNGREGVMVYQHIPGSQSSFAVASDRGDEAMNIVLSRLSEVMRLRFGIDVHAKA